MRLAEYIEQNGLTRAEFARRINVRHITVTRYVRDGQVPTSAKMAEIIAVTNGEVTANDFFDLTRQDEAA